MRQVQLSLELLYEDPEHVDQLNHEQEMLDLRKGLITNMKGVISPQKILMLLEAEKEFRVELMRRVSHGRSTGVGRSEDRR